MDRIVVTGAGVVEPYVNALGLKHHESQADPVTGNPLTIIDLTVNVSRIAAAGKADDTPAIAELPPGFNLPGCRARADEVGCGESSQLDRAGVSQRHVAPAKAGLSLPGQDQRIAHLVIRVKDQVVVLVGVVAADGFVIE